MGEKHLEACLLMRHFKGDLAKSGYKRSNNPMMVEARCDGQQVEIGAVPFRVRWSLPNQILIKILLQIQQIN